MISVTNSVTEAFHKQYYRGAEVNGGVLFNTRWMGYQIVKCPLDLWIYQEIIVESKPDLIIETGTYNGGSALYLAHVCDAIGQGEIVTVDIHVQPNRPRHPRISYLTGSSIEQNIVSQIFARAQGKKSVMVILDSDHSQRHVLGEMRAFHSLVSPGNYMIVEDSNVNGHPVREDHGPGPMEAIRDFQNENQDFQIDYAREKMMLTMNPSGYLRKKK